MRWAKLFHTFINSKRLFQLQSVFAKQVILDLQPLLTSFTPRNMSFGGMLTENRNSYIFKKLVVERQMTLLLTSEIASFFFLVGSWNLCFYSLCFAFRGYLAGVSVGFLIYFFILFILQKRKPQVLWKEKILECREYWLSAPHHLELWSGSVVIRLCQAASYYLLRKGNLAIILAGSFKVLTLNNQTRIECLGNPKTVLPRTAKFPSMLILLSLNFIEFDTIGNNLFFLRLPGTRELIWY